MRLGSVQRDIVAYLERCGNVGGAICSTTKASELAGYDLAQVERALSSLIRRGIVHKASAIRYVLVPS